MTLSSLHSHWGFVIVGYGLTLLCLTLLICQSALRLHRAKKRLKAFRSLRASTSSPTSLYEKD